MSTSDSIGKLQKSCTSNKNNESPFSQRCLFLHLLYNPYHPLAHGILKVWRNLGSLHSERRVLLGYLHAGGFSPLYLMHLPTDNVSTWLS